MSICKLCNKETTLLKKSHIIPDFFYREGNLFDKSHKLNKLNIFDFLKGIFKVIRPSSGEYDKDILCKDCDGIIISQYEDYTRKALYGGELANSENPKCENVMTSGGMGMTICRDLNYNKFKICILSILWRAHHSKREMFEEIKLSLEQEKSIKDFINNVQSCDDTTWPLICFTYLNDKKIPNDLIIQPTKVLSNNCDLFVFPINGMVFMIFADIKGVPEFMKECRLKSNNTMEMIHIPEGKGWDFIKNYCGIK